MDEFTGELLRFGDLFTRIAVALLLGGLIGWERELHGRWAGLRTHMALSLGAAVFAFIGSGLASAPSAEATRVVQGIAAGIGFVGAGTILKLSDQLEVKGLTTASAIWLTAALGTAAGFAMYTLAITAALTSLVVLALLRPLDKRIGTSVGL